MGYDITKEIYVNKYLETKDTLRLLKDKYNDLVKNTFNLMGDLYPKESILNFSRYVEQRKSLKQLKSIYKTEKENGPKRVYYNYNLKSDNKLVIEKSEASLIEEYVNSPCGPYWDERNKQKIQTRIDKYEELIKKYSRSYNRYMAKINKVITTYDKGFAKRNAHKELDLTK